MADAALSSLLAESSIRLDSHAADRLDAVRQCGQALLEAGAVDESYIDAMLQREQSVSTFVGEGVAIPHGTLAGKEAVKQDALVVLRFPGGVDWDGNDVRVCVGIAAAGGGHIALLSQLAEILLDPAKAEQLRSATQVQQVYDLLTPEDD
ncbi:PTS sugar transporter subunit IIA [Amnibacterium sp.]|uniref:PTS sugar transporter subunit IIA n=1 Tax=Amnibacterium sp. TaxID=1872496 RepID=UPI002624E2B2|nr:PTS sugar transporter subunit IIA [Amnibacterium sp.]MCU1471958.1 fruB [Amnibacterium sp.]